MWSLRGLYSVARTLPSQFFPTLSSQQRGGRTISFVTSAVANSSRRWSSMLLCHKNIHIPQSTLLVSITQINNINALNNLPHNETRRCMSKFLSKSATKRLPLNTKRAGKGYYKGKGCTSEGRLTSKGKFIADPMKKLQLVVPDLTGFSLKPYIARTVAKSPPKDQASSAGL